MVWRPDAPRLTLAQYRDISNAITEGESLRGMARRYGVSRTALVARLEALGLPAHPVRCRPRPVLTVVQRKVFELRGKRVPTAKVARRLGITPHCVRQHLYEAKRRLAARSNIGTGGSDGVGF
jgi:DNA-binding CsgD family transcriptional regulator